MVCTKCGNKNEEESKFCTSCGEPLSQTKEQLVNSSKNANSTSNQGGIRKTMKADAKSKVKGSLIGAVAVYLVICGIIGAISGGTANGNITTNSIEYNVKITSFISEIITMLVGIVFSFGLIAACFKTTRGKEVTFAEIFKLPFEHIKEIGYILLLTVICGAVGFVAGLLTIIPILGFLAIIALIVALVYYSPAIGTFSMILADIDHQENLSFTDTVKKSLEIVKGHRVEYYGVTLSFIGWLLLSLITCGILLIWVIPYMQLTMVNMYRRWIGEEEFATSQTGLSNGAVIGISAGGIGCGFIILVVFFASIFMGIVAATSSNGGNIKDILNNIEQYSDTYNDSEYDFSRYFEDLNINK